MNIPTFLSILKNFFKGLNASNGDDREGYINYDDKGSGTYTANNTYYLFRKLFSFVRESNVYSESGEKTRLDKYLKNKYYEKLGIQTNKSKKVEDDKAKITYGCDTNINN